MAGSEIHGLIHAGYKGQDDAIGILRIRNSPHDVSAGRPLFIDTLVDTVEPRAYLRLYGFPKWNFAQQLIPESQRQYKGTYSMWPWDYANIFQGIAHSVFVVADSKERRQNYDLMVAMELPQMILDYAMVVKK